MTITSITAMPTTDVVNTTFRAAYVHVLADALTSVLAIVALLAARFYGWMWIDPAVGMIGAVVIASWPHPLVRHDAARHGA